MPAYELRYLDADGTLKARVDAECANDTQAKVLAHALKADGAKRIEVWDGTTLIYQRPDRAACAVG